jgi:hypothetical protein
MRHGAGGDDLVSHLDGQVDRDREAKPDAAAAGRAGRGGDGGTRRRHPDQIAGAINQRPAAVAGIDGRVGLYGVDQQRRLRRLTGDVDRAAKRTDDPARHGAGQTQGSPERHRALTDSEIRGIADRDGPQAGLAGDAEHGQIGEGVAARDRRAGRAPVLEHDLKRATPDGRQDHVIVGQDVPLGPDDLAGAHAARLAAAGEDRDHRGKLSVGDRGHIARGRPRGRGSCRRRRARRRIDGVGDKRAGDTCGNQHDKDKHQRKGAASAVLTGRRAHGQRR